MVSTALPNTRRKLAARRWITALSIVAMLVFPAQSALAHAFGHYWVLISGKRIYGHSTAQTYSGVDLLYVELNLRNASNVYQGQWTASCLGSCTGQFTSTQTYATNWDAMSRHCGEATDGHKMPSDGTLGGTFCHTNTVDGFHHLHYWTNLS